MTSPSTAPILRSKHLLGIEGLTPFDVTALLDLAETYVVQGRATVSGLRYLVEISMGALALMLEGHLYDRFHAHGPAIQLLLATIPITLIALLFLPEPAGKTLEEMSGG